MSRKDYVLIARYLKEYYPTGLAVVDTEMMYSSGYTAGYKHAISALQHAFSVDNWNFDRVKFKQACNVDKVDN